MAFEDVRKGPGRPRLPMTSELAAIRIRPNSEVRRLMNLLMDLPLSQLEAKSANPRTPALDLMITNCILRAIKTSDFRIVQFLLDRMLGPMKSEPDVMKIEDQVRAEIELEKMAIEDVRALASKRGSIIDAE